MNTVARRCMFVGISLALAALTARRFIEEMAEEGGEAKPAPAPPLPWSNAEASIAKAVKAEAPRDPVAPLAPKAAVPRFFAAPTVTFSGKLVRNGPSFALRETAGILYPLDYAGRAGRFEGEDVRVTGKLDLDTRLLYVDAIESNVA